jgi:phosphonate transport system permease protein
MIKSQTCDPSDLRMAKAVLDRSWRFPQPYGLKTVVIAFVAIVVLVYTGRHVEVGRMIELTADAALVLVGVDVDSQVARGVQQIGSSLFPLQVEERTELSRIEQFDRDNLPWFSHLETVESQVQRLNPETLQTETHTQTTEYVVQPFGYVIRVIGKLIETLEIALWGTIFAILLSLPLAFFSASNYTPNRFVYAMARGVVSFLRAVPELVSALFLVMAYGFGPIAGVLALAFHSAGFLGKFYAEDIENADPKPQEALRAIGANKLKVLRYAVLPEVVPQYIAYTLYVLDRNVRMATVIGIVGAGGIGQELKGRFDMFNYQHVGTILVAIFLTVFVIDQLAARLRQRYL